LLMNMGRAQPADPDDLRGCWKLQLAGTIFSGRKGSPVATSQSQCVDDDKGDLGAA
jgi:hypothetical protein